MSTHGNLEQMTDSIKFEALKSDNYYTWKQNMQAALVLKDLWDAVEQDGTYAALEAAGKNKADQKATALIQVKISGELKTLIAGKETAKVASKQPSSLRV